MIDAHYGNDAIWNTTRLPNICIKDASLIIYVENIKV